MLYLEVLILPILAMMGMGFLYSSTLRAFGASRWAPVFFGGLFGIAILAAMTYPISLGDGFIFDLRSLLVGLSVVFCGWIAGLVAVAIGAIYRIYLGGGGMITGLVGLGFAYSLGLLWRQYALPRVPQNFWGDAGLGVFISLTLLALFMLPYEVAVKVISDLAVPITIANILGAVALSFVFRREIKYVADAEQFKVLASVDPLTKLLNRRVTAERIAELRGMSNQGCVLFYFDIDKFKQINDSHGHAAGDAVLATVAARIENDVRDQSIFSRYGGDEFTLFLSNVESHAVRQIAERIRKVVAEYPIPYEDSEIAVTISIGAYWCKTSCSFDEMLLMADQELLEAKQAGRNCAKIALDAQAFDAQPSAGFPLARALH